MLALIKPLCTVYYFLKRIVVNLKLPNDVTVIVYGIVVRQAHSSLVVSLCVIIFTLTLLAIRWLCWLVWSLKGRNVIVNTLLTRA